MGGNNMSLVEQINSTIFCIDCHDLGREKRTGSYVIKGKKVTLIETSASPSVPYILKGLKELNINCDDIEHIIVTHIHLDHSGGVGLFLQECKNATVYVHPKGARHLEDPSRLIASARTVYGDDFDKLFDPIVAIPKERLKSMEHEEQLVLEDRTLTFYHSPGHANHHFSIHDSLSNGLFTGDTAGVYYRELQEENLVLPSTSPNQFSPEAMLQSLKMFEQLNPDCIYFGHFGCHSNPSEVYQQMRYWLPLFVQCGEQAVEKYEDTEKRINETVRLLDQLITNDLLEKGIHDNHPVFEIIRIDLPVCAMGIVDYLMKRSVTR